MSRFSILPLILSISTYANIASQTDWSGDTGLWGPVSSWGNESCLITDLDGSIEPGSLLLSSQITQYDIATDYNGSCSVCLCDVDGDGDQDIISSARYDDLIWWVNADSSGLSWIPQLVDDGFGGTVDEVADIDGDGEMDIVGASWYGGNISWWENTDCDSGKEWNRHFIVTNYSSAQSAYPADLDGDGDYDVLGSSFYDHRINWWENTDGSGLVWSQHTIDPNINDPRNVISVDMDGDGDNDALATSVGLIIWYENVAGTGASWNEHVVSSSIYLGWDVYTGDIDGDGDLDVLSGSEDLCWWERQDSSGTLWSEHEINTNTSWGFQSVELSDIDSDGDLDALAAASSGDYIAYWLNEGAAGTFGEKQIISPGYDGASSVAAGDLNSDGVLDVAGTAYEGDVLSWWNLNTYVQQGSLESCCLYLGNDPGWGMFDWESEEPEGSSIGFQLRSSDTPDSSGMGAWSDVLSSPCDLTGILDEGDSYCQYRAILASSIPASTPVLEEVSISWNPVGITEMHQPGTELLGIEPNPASGTSSILFSLPVSSAVELTVFNLTGHLVSTPARGEYSSGIHEVHLGELIPGIYFCRITSGDFAAARKFVIIE